MSEPISSIRSLRQEAGMGGDDEVDRALVRLFEEGRKAWPDIALPLASFVRHVGRHSPGPALSALHAADFYLACACSERVPGSVEAFLSRHQPDLEAALRSRNVPAAERDELRQEIWAKLTVGRPGAPPKIGDYAGRGPLGGWVRVATVRTALNFLKQKRQEVPSSAPDTEEAAEPSSPDPELAFLKSHYRDEVGRALRDALGGLPADERNVLRLYFLDGLSIDRIASVYGVHRATAARWVARGRDSLLKGVQELLGQRLRIGRAEVDSLVGFVKSQLDVTLSSLFRAPEAQAG